MTKFAHHTAEFFPIGAPFVCNQYVSPKMNMLSHSTRSRNSSTLVVDWSSGKSSLFFPKNQSMVRMPSSVSIFGYTETSSAVKSSIPGGKGVLPWRRHCITRLYWIGVSRRYFNSCSWRSTHMDTGTSRVFFVLMMDLFSVLACALS